MSIKVSIIIPVYNVEQYLARCLDSAINQTYKNIELIIVNDGSTDNSQMIIDGYAQKDNRIKAIIQKNKGLSGARNTGIGHATGDYYFFLDSDDYIKPNAIELLINKSHNIDIVIANMMIVYGDGRTENKNFISSQIISNCDMENSQFKFDYFYRRAYGINACNKLYRAEFIRKLSLKFQPNNEVYAEDLLFNLKCLVNMPKIQVIEDYTYFYYQNSNSITKTFKPNLSKRFSSLIKDFEAYCTTLGVIEKQKDLLCYTLCISIGSVCQNVFNNSNHQFVDIKKEIIQYYRYCDVDNIVKMEYFNPIRNKVWKVFYSIFAFVYKRKLFNIAALMQYFRFEICKLCKTTGK